MWKAQWDAQWQCSGLTIMAAATRRTETTGSGKGHSYRYALRNAWCTEPSAWKADNPDSRLLNPRRTMMLEIDCSQVLLHISVQIFAGSDLTV